MATALARSVQRVLASSGPSQLAACDVHDLWSVRSIGSTAVLRAEDDGRSGEGTQPKVDTARAAPGLLERVTSRRSVTLSAERLKNALSRRGSAPAARGPKVQPARWLERNRAARGPSAADKDYAPLGKVGLFTPQQPADAVPDSEADASEMMRRLHRRDRRVINAKRAFDIKDQYRPADLNPYARDREFARERERESEEIHSRLPMEGVEFDYTDAQVRREVDFRNIGLLTAFTGRQGMLLGRRAKHVRAVTQRKAARAVKTARQMALLPPVGLHPALVDEETQEVEEDFADLQEIAQRQEARR